ncbi:UNVERIFIED_CONTAM: hypothetical protein NCL1_56341 [Trichonephila clavipes]
MYQRGCDHCGWHHRCPHRAQFQPAPAHGGDRRRQAGDHPLSGAGTLPLAYPCAGQAGNRAHPPDSCAHEPRRLSAGGRSRLCRAFPHPAGGQPEPGAEPQGISPPGPACPLSRTGSPGHRQAHEVGVGAAG